MGMLETLADGDKEASDFRVDSLCPYLCKLTNFSGTT